MRERILAQQHPSIPDKNLPVPQVVLTNRRLIGAVWRVGRCAGVREFVEREYPQHAEEWNDPSNAALS